MTSIKKKILFLVPPYFNVDDFINKHRANVLPAFTIPYGILSLEAFLKKNCKVNVETKILDLNIYLREIVNNNLDIDYKQHFNALIGQCITDFDPDIVGISALFNSSFRYMDSLSSAVKGCSSSSIIIAGGGLCSAAFEKVLQDCPSIDAICKGEGELPIKSLLDSLDERLVLESHPSWITRRGLQEGKVPSHTFVQDLDDIPFLNYQDINLDDYNSRSIDKRFADIPKREMAIHTSRGCPFLCVFCSNPSLHGRDVRVMSIDKVISEVTRMKNEFGMTVLMIEDDHFFNDQNRAKEILRRLVALKVRVEFPNGVAVYAIDEEVACLFSQAGVSSVALAVESGSDYVLNKIIKKPLKKRLVKPAVEALRKYGVMSHAFIVIGLPGEMPEHRKETLDMLLGVGFDWIHVYCAIPIYGSRLYDICADNGYIENTNQLDFVNTKSVIRAPGVDPVEIEKIAYQMNLEVNFVNNYNLMNGNYEIAISYFNNVCEKYPDHAFAHYFLASAYYMAGINYAIARNHEAEFVKIVEKDYWWLQQARLYNLTVENLAVLDKHSA